MHGHCLLVSVTVLVCSVAVLHRVGFVLGVCTGSGVRRSDNCMHFELIVVGMLVAHARCSALCTMPVT